VVFRVVSDRAPAEMDSLCIELAAGGAARFGKKFDLASRPLPQTISAVTESRESVQATATGERRALPVARDRRELNFKSGQVLHVDLSLNVCLPSPTQGQFAKTASVDGAVDRAVLLPAAGAGAIAVAFSSLQGGKVTRYSEKLVPLSGGLAAAPQAIHDLEIADLDGDCRGDLLVAGDSPAWWGRAAGGEFPKANALSGSSGAIAAGDVDGDGAADLVIAAGAEIHLLLNDGKGSFREASGAFDSAPTAASLLQLGDLDGDGDLDLVVGQQAAPGRVYFSDGSGHFTLVEAALPPRNLMATALALADLDGDNDLDLMIASHDAGARVYLNRGDGFLEDRTFALVPASTDVPGILVADLNGDCLPDAVIAGTTPQLWLSMGAGKMSVGPDLGVGEITGASAEDADGDGRPDLLLYGARGLELLVQK
jgi:hypothetical protein